MGGDVGWNSWEEIDQIKAGGNYGWPCYEGELQTVGFNCSIDGAIAPLYYYGHNASGAGSVTSGAFPSGSAYPSEYANTFFFGDYAQNWIKMMTLTPSGAVESIKDFADAADGSNGPVEFVTGPEGNVYFIAIYKGQLKRITYTLGNRNPIVVMDATPLSGLAPLSVNFHSDGTNDPDGDPISFEWNFGDGASSSDVNPVHVYTTNGNFTAVLTVRDNKGGVQSKSLSIQVGNWAPHVAITSPKDGSFYVPGATLTLTGTGMDPEDGILPETALSWRVILHHNTHIHILESHVGNNIAITAPEHSDPSVYTEIELTGSDSAGLTHTASINIYLNNSASDGGNLIRNASFEKIDPLNPQLPEGWNGTWWGNLGAIFTYPVEGYEGPTSRAAKLQLTQYVEGDAKWGFSPVFVNENTLYSFSDHYFSTVESSAVLQVGYPDGTFKYTVLATIPPSGTWKEFATTFTTPPGARTVSVFHELKKVGTLTVDAYMLTQGTSNLIKNPSLEEVNNDGTPVGWNKNTWGNNNVVFNYPVAGHSGARAAEISFTSYTDGDAKWYPDDVAITPGITYTYSDWYKANDISDIIGRYTMADGKSLFFGVAKELVRTTEWKQAIGSFIPPTGAVSGTFLHLTGNIATLTIDDASLVASESAVADVEHPNATLTSPVSSSILSDMTTLSATALDNIGVTGVQFLLDGAAVGPLLTTAPYSYTLDSRMYENGPHTISVRAEDAAGNVGTAPAVNVTIDNTTTETGTNLIKNP